MRELPEVLAAFGFFGAVFICPLVYMLMKHQRAMAEIIHRGANADSVQRLELLEREVLELRAARYERVLREDPSQLERHLTR
jgi:hypothetical protein